MKRRTDLAYLGTMMTEWEASLLEALLKTNKVPFVRMNNGYTGSFRSLGTVAFGCDFYVDPTDLEQAKDLLPLLESAELDRNDPEWVRMSAYKAYKWVAYAALALFLVKMILG